VAVSGSQFAPALPPALQGGPARCYRLRMRRICALACALALGCAVPAEGEAESAELGGSSGAGTGGTGGEVALGGAGGGQASTGGTGGTAGADGEVALGGAGGGGQAGSSGSASTGGAGVGGGGQAGTGGELALGGAGAGGSGPVETFTYSGDGFAYGPAACDVIKYQRFVGGVWVADGYEVRPELARFEPCPALVGCVDLQAHCGY
jgi:hypothetical protein